MANIRGKYHTVTVTPTCFAGLNVNGDSIFLPTEIPNACYSGGTSLLKSIRLFDKDDLGVDMNLLFFEFPIDLRRQNFLKHIPLLF